MEVSAEKRPSQHTYQLILHQQDDEEFADWIAAIKSLRAAGTLATFDVSLPPPDIRFLDDMLNHYEFLCAAIWCGDVDEKLIKRCEKSRLIAIYETSKRYIDANREYGDQRSMWRNF